MSASFFRNLEIGLIGWNDVGKPANRGRFFFLTVPFTSPFTSRWGDQ